MWLSSYWLGKPFEIFPLIFPDEINIKDLGVRIGRSRNSADVVDGYVTVVDDWHSGTTDWSGGGLRHSNTVDWPGGMCRHSVTPDLVLYLQLGGRFGFKVVCDLVGG